MKATIEELQVFITIVEVGTIVGAASKLAQTPSSVSRHLQRLEKKLNVTLLERTTRMIDLTDSGELFLKYAKEVLDKLEEAEDAVLISDVNLSGMIKIDAATPFVLHVLTPLIMKFTTLYPDIKIELSNNEYIIDLMKENVDVAIRIGELEDSTLQAKLLMQSKVQIVASPEYLNKYGTPNNIEDLKQHKCLGFSQLTNLNAWPIYDGDKPYIVEPMISSSNGEVLRNLALQGAGIVRLSNFLIEKDLQAGRLIQIFTDQIVEQKHNVYAVYQKKTYLPKRLRLLIDFLYAELS